MCGRFALTASPEEVARLFGYLDRPNFPPREDIRPTEPIGVVVRAEGARRFRLVRWGFVPAWAKDPAALSLMINARAETALEKPSFRAAARHGRCLVPATAWIEWRRDGASKTAFRIARRDGGLMAFAGLTETWAGADGSEIDTAAVLTVDANADVAAIHDRMPALIAPEHFAAWLDDPRIDAKAALALARPAPLDLLEAVALAPRAPPPRPPRPARAKADATPPPDRQMKLF
ncbi:MAG: SOS response-associated peptidase [Siculibacillus sp.]